MDREGDGNQGEQSSGRTCGGPSGAAGETHEASAVIIVGDVEPSVVVENLG